MSYPQQPGGPQGPYGYGQGSHGYGQPPPRRNNTVWWVLGVIAGVVVLCCCAGVVWFGFLANEVRQSVTSAVSSYSTSSSVSSGSPPSSATPVSEGAGVTLGDAAVQSGWSVLPGGDISGLEVTNTSSTAESFLVTVYYLQGGVVLDQMTCSSGTLQPAETGDLTCFGSADADGYDEIRMDEGF